LVDLSRVIVSFIVINQFVVWFLRVDYIATEENLRAKQEQIQGQIDAIDEEIKKQKK